MVVVLDSHFEIEADEFGQMTVSVRVLSAEHATDGEHFAETESNLKFEAVLVETNRLTIIVEDNYSGESES